MDRLASESRHLPDGAFLIFTTIGILALVGDRIWETRENKEGVQANAVRLATISHAVCDKRVALRSRPSTPEEYAYLWGGYTGYYHVYNPPYHADKNVKEDEIVNVLVHRYKDPSFLEARYIFLTGDKAGQEDLKAFLSFHDACQTAMSRCCKQNSGATESHQESASTCEMYLGTRYGKDRAVMELKEPVMVSQHGMPHYYLIIDDNDIVNHYLKDHFEPAGDSPEAQELTIFGDI